MASTFSFSEDNGAASGSPAKGTTRTNNRTDCNWKNIDDSTTDPSAAMILAGNNSYEKFQFGVIGGTFTQLSNCKFAHTGGAFPANCTLKGLVSSTYTTPGTTANVNLTNDMTSAIDINSGLSVNFSTTGPQAAGSTSTLAATGYTQYLITQLQTTAAAPAGLTASITLTVQYDET
ncbi:MAG: hypothetical protein KGI71_05885 [Patescibacteria group bacterium]|nr:hypothetical protein [Patescibacteria group bacterium]